MLANERRIVARSQLVLKFLPVPRLDAAAEEGRLEVNRPGPLFT